MVSSMDIDIAGDLIEKLLKARERKDIAIAATDSGYVGNYCRQDTSVW